MEPIHKPDTRPWILPGKIRVKDFVQIWKDTQVNLELEINKKNLAEKTINYLNNNIDGNIISMLEEECNPSNLDCEGENESVYCCYDKTIDIADNINLETVKLQRQHLELYKSDRSYRTAVMQSSRYRNQPIRVNKSLGIKTERPDEENLISEMPEVVLTVQFYRPVRYESHFGTTHRYSFVADQELNVLGCQKLTQLKDAFTCVSDIANPGDCSEAPSTALNIAASDMYKSSFLFINNTFYNDVRDAGNIDYSQVIVNWANEPNRGIGPFTSASMDETTFNDLEIQLGYPYLYMHQGDCEHVIVFSDIRLLSPITDSLDKSDYPKIISTNRRIQTRCGMCNLNTSKWVTFGSKRLPFDPFFFCDVCFKMFNYNEKEEKIGEFKAYPYLDKTALL